MSRDWPLYSGVPVLCSGGVGLWLVSCCRYYYPPYSNTQGFCIFPITTYSLVGVIYTNYHSHQYFSTDIQSTGQSGVLGVQPGDLHLPHPSPDHPDVLHLRPSHQDALLLALPRWLPLSELLPPAVAAGGAGLPWHILPRPPDIPASAPGLTDHPQCHLHGHLPVIHASPRLLQTQHHFQVLQKTSRYRK